jgi:NAD+ synthetase
LFDGRSLAAWPNGEVVIAPAWEEGILLIDVNDSTRSQWISIEGKKSTGLTQRPGGSELVQDEETVLEALADAVVLGLRDYCRKSGIKRIVLGLSGGIDSAVAACVACAAVGPENVLGLSMPSRFSSEHSKSDAKYTAESLGMDYASIPIDELHHLVENQIESVLDNGSPVARENIQARLRAIIVMSHANAQQRMAIATGNKSELAQGYCTLYGDMAGGYTPLGDVYKMEVYGLANVFNNRAGKEGKDAPVNESTLTKPPSAELAPDQRDDDTLPPYTVLDSILKHHIENGLGADEIAATGHDRETVVTVLRRLEANEHKRWQMAPAPRVSPRAFGQGWRHPLASRHDWRR